MSRLTADIGKPHAISQGLTLADYYPEGTTYFYSFPAGEDSQFYNQVPTFDEELVSARPLVCAGAGIKVVTFAASSNEYVLGTLARNLELTDISNIISLPSEISVHVTGSNRNDQVKRALYKALDDEQLVMAQPFLDDVLSKKFKINPELSVTLSDKNNKQLYIPSRFLPQDYAVFGNGLEFSRSSGALPLPCVVKVASSSAGDGVVICNNTEDLAEAKRTFRHIKASILVEEHIDAQHNICIQFGISHKSSVKPTIIGFNEQVTSVQGNFLGGIVNLKKNIPYLEDVNHVLINEILPKIRALGWYGIGGIDVLIKSDGEFYFIDPNLRMTATYAYVYLAKINKIVKPLISFTGEFSSGKSEFEASIMPLTEGPDSFLTLVSLSQHDGVFRFNGGIEFDSISDLKLKAAELLRADVSSTVLSNILHGDFGYEIQ